MQAAAPVSPLVRGLVLALLVVLAGCSAPVADPGARGPWEWPEDPPTDRLGWEDGYWYNESIAVDQSDGLNASERRAFVGRAMARVERIRGLEFEKRVPVKVISREEFRERRGGGDRSNTTRAQFRNAVWEAYLLVGEDRDVTDVFGTVYGGTVAGFYAPKRDEIVLVSDSERPTVDRTTLSHELVHALQDQHLSFLPGAAVRDRELARAAVTEGDANYVEALYEERCAADWECVPRPGGGGANLDSRNLGLFLSIFVPYSDGPTFVHRVRQRGGWAAVNDLYEDPPVSTEQVIHPEAYPEETPARVRIPDRSSAAWQRFDLRQPADVAGEATIFAALWFHRVANRSDLTSDDEPYSPYDYRHPASVGWNGDLVVPYHTDDGQTGYVWRLRWDSREDAREFAAAYRTLLVEKLNATVVREGVYRVPEWNPFGDAFRVTRSGTTVTVVNAPTVRQLDLVHRPMDAAQPRAARDTADPSADRGSTDHHPARETAESAESADAPDAVDRNRPRFSRVRPWMHR